MLIRFIPIAAFLVGSNEAFVVRQGHSLPSVCLAAESAQTAAPEATTEIDEISQKRKLAKAALFGLIGTSGASVTGSSMISSIENIDPVLADPVTKGSLVISTTGTLLGGLDSSSGGGAKVLLTSEDNVYTGRANTYYNLLRKQEDDVTLEGDDEEEGEGRNMAISGALNSLQMFIPPPLRPVLSSSGLLPGYIPMRDLFTSPSVSFAYERGWRQGFASAGFPGADKEYEMVREFFMPINPKTVVDMSCATGMLSLLKNMNDGFL